MTEEIITLSQKVSRLEAELNDLRTSEFSRQMNEVKAAFDALIAEAQSFDSKLLQKPTLTIAARPEKPGVLSKLLFGGPESPVVQVLDSGVEERSGGFGLGRAYSGSRIVRGQYRVANSPGHDLRLVARDGSSVLVATAGESFLSWAMKAAADQILLNPIAIAEYVYSVAIFLKKIAEAGNLSQERWNVISEWKNIGSGGQRLVLPTGRINSVSFLLGGHPVEEMDVRSSEDLRLGENAEGVAYRILKMIYNAAGASDAQIPYVIREQEVLDIPGLYAA